MNTKLRYFITTLLLLPALLSFSQTDSEAEYPHWFVGIQGGAQVSPISANMQKFTTPQVAIQGGRWFMPEFGVRLHIMALQYKGEMYANAQYNIPNESFKYNDVVGSVDAIVNMTNLLFPRRQSHLWNWNVIAGIGAGYSWGYGDFLDKYSTLEYPSLNLMKSRYTHFQFRTGMQVEYNVNRTLSINAEAQLNNRNSQYNLSDYNRYDWQLAAFIGVSYKFGHGKSAFGKPLLSSLFTPKEYTPKKDKNKHKKKAQSSPLTAQSPEPTAQSPELTAQSSQLTSLHEVAYYDMNSVDTDVEELVERVVTWMKANPKKKIIVSGYADRGTGEVQTNMLLSSQRATRVADAIKAKGIPAHRIIVAAYGDTAQPFAEVIKNRCVIVEGK